MEKMTIREKIAATLMGCGLLGAVMLAESLELGIRTYLICEVPCFAILLFGILIKKTAETEAPAANTMKGGKTTANS